MTSPHRPLRLLLLALLLPWLAVAGLGRGAVVCIAPGGHLELELAGDGCCGEDPLPADDGDCDSCVDVELTADVHALHEDGGPASPLVPPVRGLAQPPPGPGVAAFSGAAPRRAKEPPHLRHLRSVRLRC